MLFLTANTTPKPFLSTPFLPHYHPPPPPLYKPPPRPLSVSALIIPSSSSPGSFSTPAQKQQQLYQPYRPPPSPLPARYRTLDTNARLEILSNRLGLWFEYSSLIPSLISEGFTSSILEDITGIASIEQNLFVVAGQVRDSLIEATDHDTVSYFDSPGSPEILYEIRILNTQQRADAARFIIQHGFDSRRAEELARSMKDHPRRFGERGWESFDGNIPGDCLAFMYYRQAHEHRSASVMELSSAAFEKALEVVETERARIRVLEDMDGKFKEDETAVEDVFVKVPVVRMGFGEVAESSKVVVLPVCRAEEREMEVEEAPWDCGMVGQFGIVQAERGWSGWVVLPGWLPIVGLDRGAVAVRFPKAKRVLPWKDKRKDLDEEILVVVDRGHKEVASEEGFYLVVGGGNGSGDESLKVERGSRLKAAGADKSLGTVVLVVRPPRDDLDDQLAPEDWD
ncbi:hypothetical protein C2S51_030537 [Perilla frutescens var. frutescens]|nr:hypothetical protein C2S51_030537 [Perilla frutescens var. frutescens]